MDIKPIRSEADYDAALQEIETLFDVEPGTAEADRLEILVMLVEAYEAQHHRIPPPTRLRPLSTRWSGWVCLGAISNRTSEAGFAFRRS